MQFDIDKSDKVVYRLDYKLSNTIKKMQITFRFYCWFSFITFVSKNMSAAGETI